MLPLISLWLVSPFAAGALLGASPRARRLAGRHYPAFITLGVAGLALVVLGAFVLQRPLSLVALGLGGPLSGLSFWVRRQDGGDDGPDDGRDDPDPPPPGGDWERIVKEFERHVEPFRTPPGRRRDGSRTPSKPPSPSPV